MARIKYKEAIDMKVGKGRPAVGKRPDKKDLKRLYVKESKSIREAAEELRCSKDTVYRALQEYGIPIRTNKRRSKLEKYKLSELEKGIRAKSIREYARELGVDESTLRHHLKIRSKQGQRAGDASHNKNFVM